MDCRRPLVVWLGMLALAAGCSHPVAALRVPNAPAGKKDDGETVVHQAATYVAYGDFRASSAYAGETPPAMQQQLREDARLAYLKALEIDPKHIPAYLALARLQQRTEDYTGAVATYQKALSIDPKDANLWYELSMCQCRQKKWIDAVVNLRRAIELNPNSAPYRKTLGYTLGRAGRLEESLQVLAEVEGEAQATYDLGRMLHHMHQTDVARQYTHRAQQLDPNLPGLQKFVALLDGNAEAGDPAVQAAAYQPLPGEANAPAPLAAQVTATATELTPQMSVNSVTPNKSIRMPPLPIVRKTRSAD